MDRTQFFQLAQKVAIYTNGFANTNKPILKECVVEVGGISYYPVSIEVGFDANGNTKNTSILRDLKANSVTKADLQKVKIATT